VKSIDNFGTNQHPPIKNLGFKHLKIPKLLFTNLIILNTNHHFIFTNSWHNNAILTQITLIHKVYLGLNTKSQFRYITPKVRVLERLTQSSLTNTQGLGSFQKTPNTQTPKENIQLNSHLQDLIKNLKNINLVLYLKMIGQNVDPHA
jgi:hypothetical protein